MSGIQGFHNLLESFIIEFKTYKKEVDERLEDIKNKLAMLTLEIRSLKEKFPKNKKQAEKDILEYVPMDILKDIEYETNSPKAFFIKHELPRILQEEEIYLKEVINKAKGKMVEEERIESSS